MSKYTDSILWETTLITGKSAAYAGGTFGASVISVETSNAGWNDSSADNCSVSSESSAGHSEQILVGSTEEPIGVESTTCAAGLMSSTGTAATIIGPANDEFIVSIRKKDAVPYSRVESRAETVYNKLHNIKTERKSPCIIAETPEAVDEINSFIANGEDIRDKLESLREGFIKYVGI